MARLKYDYEMLKNIFDEGCATLLVDYKDKYITRDSRIIGKCILCENSFNKSLNKLHKQRNFGCETCAKIVKFERIKNTMFDKYGVEYAAKSEHFRDKMKITTLERYGVEHGTQSKEVKEKIRKTNLEKYGFEYGLQNEEVKEKRRLSNLEKYGFENPLQREEIKEKCKKTNAYLNYSRGTKSIIDTLYKHYANDPTCDIEKLGKFFEFNDKLDQSRNSKLIDYIPELEEARVKLYEQE